MSAGAAFVFALAGCRTAALQAKVGGTATYRERIALPPDAVFEATLEDVSRADAPVTVIGAARIENPGNPPYSFEIPYDPKQIDERYTYTVRARILAGGRLMFTTDTLAPVITRGNPTTVDLLLRMAGRAPVAPGPALEGNTWVLTRLAEAPITLAERQPAPDLTLDEAAKNASGSSGCNRFTGSYQLDGERLTFGVLATTMRMCPSGMELEQSYLAALGRVTGWKIEDSWLALLDGDGTVIARFTPLVRP